MPAPPLTPLAAAVLHVPVPERALVVECGEGDAVLFLAREFPTARVRGIDPSAERVRAAIARIGLDPEGRIAFKVGSSRSLPYPDGLFDLVVHDNGRTPPAELARVLRPGAHLILIRTGATRLVASFREKLMAMGLARRGFVASREEDAGNGSFQIMHLGTRDGGVSR